MFKIEGRCVVSEHGVVVFESFNVSYYYISACKSLN